MRKKEKTKWANNSNLFIFYVKMLVSVSTCSSLETFHVQYLCSNSIVHSYEVTFHPFAFLYCFAITFAWITSLSFWCVGWCFLFYIFLCYFLWLCISFIILTFKCVEFLHGCIHGLIVCALLSTVVVVSCHVIFCIDT